MRYFSLALWSAMAIFYTVSAPHTALAEDDGGFGGAVPFSNERHSAFEDPADLPSPAQMEADALAATARQLEEIQPAAGEHDNPPENQKQEVELKEKFDADLTRTTLDRADGDVSSRDRVGDGKVGVFYDHNSDDRIMDEDDAIGVELRLMEFE